jgi:allantoate deiminase
MRERALRAIAECKLIASMTEEPGHVTRRFLTAPMHAVHSHLRGRMEALGMSVRVDAAGNLSGLWQPLRAGPKRLVMGSHVDTVPDAGAFDGVLGVTLALEWVALAQEMDLPLAIEVFAFSEEEGVRFGVPFIGSRAVAGRFDSALLALKDADGHTLEDAIRFVELHIEQGPALESEGLSLAAVTGIVGQTRLSLEFAGQANHAGTTPMHLRRDALAGAAEWIGIVEAAARRAEGLVATVGKIVAQPGASNVIPGTVQMSLDVRHPLDGVRADAAEELLAQAHSVAARRSLTVQSIRQMDQPAVPMDERLTAFLAEAIETVGLPAKRMPSGAGHDAMVMAVRVPTAMLFLRSPGGISHHPAEDVLEEDVEASLQVGRKFLARLAAEVRD